MVWKKKYRRSGYIHYCTIIDDNIRIKVYDHGDYTYFEALYVPSETCFYRVKASQYWYWRTDRLVREEDISKHIKKALAKAKKPKGPSAAHDPEFEKSHPAIHEFMTCLAIDGKPRMTSSLSIFTQEGYFKCCLSEKNENKVLWASGETLGALLSNLEARLTEDDPEWRDSTPRATGKPKK